MPPQSPLALALTVSAAVVVSGHGLFPDDSMKRGNSGRASLLEKTKRWAMAPSGEEPPAAHAAGTDTTSRTATRRAVRIE